MRALRKALGSSSSTAAPASPAPAEPWDSAAPPSPLPALPSDAPDDSGLRYSREGGIVITGLFRDRLTERHFWSWST